jgi:nickel/cobalt exporter
VLEAQLLLATAALIALLHTVLGPDHYLPFIALGKSRKWSLAKTLRITFYCGLGHILSSVVIGGIGIVFGTKLTSLVAIEGMRGSLAGWVLLMFGCVYLIWGLKKAGKAHSHSHAHAHGDIVHEHHHNHAIEHAHVHRQTAKNPVTPWALFIIFILGPCEALIPLFMYPAAIQSSGLVVLVALVFGSVTLLTMLAVVAAVHYGAEKISLPGFGRYSHAAAGASIAACGAAISFIGL